MTKKIFVVIPAYNESSNIEIVIKETKKYVKDVVVVDDGSSDNTAFISENAGADVLRHIVNMGKGAALKTGCDYAIMRGAEILIAIDADGQHEPKEISNFIKNINGSEVILGYRQLNDEMPFILKLGNRFISFTVKILYGLRLRDTQCGYRAFTSNAYKKIRWKVSDYSMESEMIANMGKYHVKYKEIPIKTIYSDKYKGTTVLDGIKIVFNMVLWKLRIKNSGD